MDDVIVLFACLAVGMVLPRGNWVPDNAHTSINAFVIRASLLALTLLQVHSVTLDPALFYAALMPWLLFIVSTLLFWAVGSWLRLPRATTVALAVVGGLGNTSFMGLPLLMLLLYTGGIGLGGPTTQVTLFKAAMAPQIGGSIVAIQYGRNAPLILRMVGVGTVVSFITLPICWHVFETLGL